MLATEVEVAEEQSSGDEPALTPNADKPKKKCRRGRKGKKKKEQVEENFKCVTTHFKNELYDFNALF